MPATADVSVFGACRETAGHGHNSLAVDMNGYDRLVVGTTVACVMLDGFIKHRVCRGRMKFSMWLLSGYDLIVSIVACDNDDNDDVLMAGNE